MNNIYLKIFYVLGNIYVILALYQIKEGFSILSYFYQYQRLLLTQKDKVMFYLYKYTPFL
jgi:hypothetical protein